MNLRLQMIDTDTGEILVTRYWDFALNFGLKNDAGFRTLMEWCHSAVCGVRSSKHRSIELRFCFSELVGVLPLPFGVSDEQNKKDSLAYVR